MRLAIHRTTEGTVSLHSTRGSHRIRFYPVTAHAAEVCHRYSGQPIPYGRDLTFWRKSAIQARGLFSRIAAGLNSIPAYQEHNLGR